MIESALVLKQPRSSKPTWTDKQRRDLGSYWKVIAQIANKPLLRAEIAQGLNDCSNTQTQIGSSVFLVDKGKERQYAAEITSEMKYNMKWQQSS